MSSFPGINALAANTVEDILRRPLRSVAEGRITLLTKLFVLLYGGIILALAYLAKTLKGPITQMATTVFGACGSPILGIFLMGAAVPWANKYGALAGLATSLTFNLWISIGNRVKGAPITPLPSIGTEGCSRWAGLDNSTWGGRDDLFNSTMSLVSAIVPSNNSWTQEASSKPATSGTFVLYTISYDWYSMYGCIVCVAVGLAVSCATNRFCSSGKGREEELHCSESRLIFPFIRPLWGMEEAEVTCYDASQSENHEKWRKLNSNKDKDIPMDCL